MFAHVLDDILHCDVNGVFNNTFVEVPDDVLDHSELLEELSPCIQDLMGEDVLLAVDPQIWESFLG